MFSQMWFSGYKSFPAEPPASLEHMGCVNVIIGKNNSGKSSILDIVGAVYDLEQNARLKNSIGPLSAAAYLPNDAIDSAVKELVCGRPQRYLDQVIDRIRLTPTIIEIDSEKRSHYNPYKWKYALSSSQNDLLGDAHQCWKQASTKWMHSVSSYLEKAKFVRIDAERNIVPEAESREAILGSDGAGASNLVRMFLNLSDYNEELIEVNMLQALNQIMYPEAEFINVKVQQIQIADDYLWEIFLQERGSDRFALSKSGSGLKTIILVLLNLLILPETKNYKDARIIYGFEELENNLHPYIQRKLFDYIYDYAFKHNSIIFLTTHSHIAINTYYDKERASVYHVVKNNATSAVNRIENYVDKVDLLDDLDVKASDLLQSNGIIWVEGPSDRVYIKQWLEVMGDCKYEEGKHYQFMYYGGRLLSHYTTNGIEGLIDVLTTNRNAAIVMDSDKKNKQTPINDTKKRIEAEFAKHHMFSWITQGREIENYLPASVISAALEIELKEQCGRYSSFPEYIDPFYKRFSGRKVDFALKLKDHFADCNSVYILDAYGRIKDLCNRIRAWNKL